MDLRTADGQLVKVTAPAGALGEVPLTADGKPVSLEVPVHGMYKVKNHFILI